MNFTKTAGTIALVSGTLLAQFASPITHAEGKMTLVSGVTKDLKTIWGAGPHISTGGLEYCKTLADCKKFQEDELPVFKLVTVKRIEFPKPTDEETKLMTSSTDISSQPSLTPRKVTVLFKDGSHLDNVFVSRLWLTTADDLTFFCGNMRIVQIDITSSAFRL